MDTPTRLATNIEHKKLLQMEMQRIVGSWRRSRFVKKNIVYPHRPHHTALWRCGSVQLHCCSCVMAPKWVVVARIKVKLFFIWMVFVCVCVCAWLSSCNFICSKLLFAKRLRLMIYLLLRSTGGGGSSIRTMYNWMVEEANVDERNHNAKTVWQQQKATASWHRGMVLMQFNGDCVHTANINDHVPSTPKRRTHEWKILCNTQKTSKKRMYSQPEPLRR